MLDPSQRANKQRIKALRLSKKWSQEELAEKAGCSVRTVQNAEAGKPVKEALLECIAEALGVELADIVAGDIEPTEQPVHQLLSTPDRYAQALQGVWRSTVTRHPGVGQNSNPVPGIELEYKTTTTSCQDNRITADCECITPGFEHERFRLSASVDGQGLLLVDGYRDVADGAVHFFRSILQFSSDGKSKVMEGGFVVFDLEPRGIFLGRMRSVPFSDSEPRASG